jgi:hypothetical protein
MVEWDAAFAQSVAVEWSHYVKGCGEQAVLSAARSNLLKIKKL